MLDADLFYMPDGTVHARRIEISDDLATDVAVGPAFFASPSNRDLDLVGLQQQGDVLSESPFSSNIPYNFQTDPTFHISSRLTNIAALPFTPLFDKTSFSSGQRIAALSRSTALNGGSLTTPTTLVLEPQTVNGSIVSIENDGGFTVYTLALESADLISLFGNRSMVLAYTDASTIHEDPVSLNVGDSIRAHGLLFNDENTYRLDCEWVAAGIQMP